MGEDRGFQAAYWGGEAGRNWTRFDADLETLHAEVTDLLMAACAARPGERVLDIGCGAGGTTRALARAVAPGGAVLGLDVSEPLLAAARSNCEGIGDVSFALADVETAPIDPGFDLAASRFGVMFFSDTLAAFRNIAGALRPGGRFVFAAWAGPAHNPWFTLPARAAEARLGTLPAAPPDAPGPMAFQDAERVTGLLADAGFDAPEARPANIHLRVPEGVARALAFVRHIGPVSRIVAAKGGTQDDLAAINAAIGEGFSAYEGPEGLAVPARIVIFSARLPG